MIKCKNCGHHFEGNFCNHCGQSAKTGRINLMFLWEDIHHGLLHYDKGITYSGKQLFLKPGYIIRDYIQGKRVGHFRPISLVIVLATIYALVNHLTGVNLLSSKNDDSVKIYNYILEHYYWFIIATIPLFSISTKIAFREKHLNFAEYIIFESFKASQRLIIHTIFLPIIFLVNNPKFTGFSINFLFVVDISLIIWTNSQFFNRLSVTNVILRSLLSYAIWLVLVFIVFAIFLLLSGF